MALRFSKKVTFFGAFFTLILTALASLFFWGEHRVEPYIRQKGEEVLKTHWEFSKMVLDPLGREVFLHDVKVYHPDRKNETIAQVDEVRIELKSLASLLHSYRPIEITLEHPKILFATTHNGDWELAGRIPLLQRGEGEKRLDPFDIETVAVQDGSVEFRDGRKGVEIPLSKVEFKADHWRLPSKEEPLPVSFEASFKILNSAEAKVKGKGDFLSPQTSLSADLKVKGLPLPPFAPYYEQGLPARVVQGAASFSVQARCDGDRLHVPVHSEVSGLKIELKKNKAFGFMADSIVDQMKNSRGNVEIDLMISGDLRRPQFVVLTDLDPTVGQGIKATGHEIKEGVKSGWKKFKGLF